MNRKQWLESLKEGDKVINITSMDGSYEVLKIKKITPTGRIRLDNGILLDEDGYYLPNNQHIAVNETYIEPYDDTVLETEVADFEYVHYSSESNILRNEVIGLFSDFRYKKYTKEQLQALKELLLQGESKL